MWTLCNSNQTKGVYYITLEENYPLTFQFISKHSVVDFKSHGYF